MKKFRFKFDWSRLRGRIVEKGFNETTLANAIGLSKAAFSSRLKGRNQFTADEILKIVIVLNIPKESIGYILFNIAEGGSRDDE